MERYTYRTADGRTVIANNDGATPFQQTMKIPNIIDRLATYEDTDLEPEEIERIVDAYGRGRTLRTESAERLEIIREIKTDRLRELAQADREGKIPNYTIGDTVYDRFGDAWEVRTAELHLLGEKPDWMYRCGHAGTDDYCALWSFEILTREEAAAALRREQDG